MRSQGTLWGIERAGGELRALVHIGNLVFHPVSAPAVRIQFEPAQWAITLTVLDPDVVVTAKKVVTMP